MFTLLKYFLFLFFKIGVNFTLLQGDKKFLE